MKIPRLLGRATKRHDPVARDHSEERRAKSRNPATAIMNSNEVPVNLICNGGVIVGARRSGRAPTASDCALEYEVSSSSNGSAARDRAGQCAGGNGNIGTC